jgi:hypothetical protein
MGLRIMEYFDNNTSYLNKKNNDRTFSDSLIIEKKLEKYESIKIPDYGESKARSEKIAHVNVKK